MVDQKGEKRANEVSPGETEDRENCRTCLYVSTKDDPTSPTVISRCLSGMGFLVTKMSKIPAARKLCKSTHYSLIVLEDCPDKKFMKDIKGPNTCNEDTPIMYISSDGKLPDLAKDLTQERYIDEVVFRCSTLEGDLSRAVNRLTVEPGQFAVTPTKSKRPPEAKKRKLDKAFSATDNPLGFWNKGPNPIHSGDDLLNLASSALGCFPFPRISPPPVTGPSIIPLPRLSPPPITGPSYTPDLTTGRQYTDLDSVNSAPVLYQPSVYENLGFQPLPPTNPVNMTGGPVWFGPTCEQHSFMYPGAYQHALQNYYHFGDQGIRAYPQRDSSTGGPASTGKQLIKESMKNSSLSNTSATEQKSSIPLGMDAPNFQLMIDSLDDRGIVANGGIQKGTAVANADLPQGRTQLPSNNERATEPKETNSQITPTFEKIPTENKSSAEELKKHTSSAERSKEHHLEKERKRRIRITKCWHWLRSMVPHCSQHADKATVFEMTVAYLHHCWKHHGQLLDQINQDFQKVIESTGTPEDLEEMVSKSLTMEGDIGSQNMGNCQPSRERQK